MTPFLHAMLTLSKFKHAPFSPPPRGLSPTSALSFGQWYTSSDVKFPRFETLLLISISWSRSYGRTGNPFPSVIAILSGVGPSGCS